MKLVSHLNALCMSCLVWFVSAYPVSSLPFDEGILTVDGREFFIGVPSRPVDPHERDWPFHFSDWLGGFIEADPVLSEYRIYLHQTGIPAARLVEENASLSGQQAKVEIAPHLQAAGHETLNRSGILFFYPQDSDLPYVARCTGPANEGFNYCSIRAAYPYGEHISLVAKRFFPGTLDDIGHSFRVIAHRMVEVAICLDVTERSPDQQPSQPADILSENPALQDCKIDLISAYPALEDSTDFAFVFGFE